MSGAFGWWLIAFTLTPIAVAIALFEWIHRDALRDALLTKLRLDAQADRRSAHVFLDEISALHARAMTAMNDVAAKVAAKEDEIATADAIVKDLTAIVVDGTIGEVMDTSDLGRIVIVPKAWPIGATVYVRTLFLKRQS